MEHQNPQEKIDKAKQVVINALAKYLEDARILESGSQYRVAGSPVVETEAQAQRRNELNEALKVLGMDVLK